MAHPHSRVNFLNPDGLMDSSVYAFSQLAVVPSGSHLAFVSGQGSGKVDGDYPADFSDQVRLALSNVETALKAIDSGLTAVAKITVLVVNHDQERHQVLIAAIKKAFPHGYPASTLIPVPRLASLGMLVEIEAVAVVAEV